MKASDCHTNSNTFSFISLLPIHHLDCSAKLDDLNCYWNEFYKSISLNSWVGDAVRWYYEVIDLV